MNSSAFEQFKALEESHWWFRGRRRIYLELLRGVLGGRRPARVLDIGSGVGGFLSQLDELGDGLIFTDLNADALNQCRSGGVGQ